MKITDPRFLDILLCVGCHQNKLRREHDMLICANCHAKFSANSERIILLGNDLAEQRAQYEKDASSPINRLKNFIKRQPWLFRFLTYAIGSISYFGWSPQKALKKIYREEDLKDKIIINIGSGIKRTNPEVINLDIFPFKEVDFVTDATKLPMKDGSVDMVITESTLEHIPDADAAIKEICRVIKPGGYVFADAPFIFPFHASPNDYARFTDKGLENKFKVFEPIKAGMRGGPVSALITFLMHFFALPFSLISDSAYNLVTYIFMIVLSPLRIFDPIFYLFPRSVDVAAITYFFGRKKS